MRHDLSKINKKKLIAVSGICMALIAMLFYTLQDKAIQQQTGKEKIKPEVEVYEVQRKDMMRRISLFGQTVSAAHIELAPKYSGRIIAVNVELGDKVEAGSVLMVQDTQDLDLSIRQNQAAVRQAEADVMESESIYQATYRKVTSNYEMKKRNYERYQSLYDEGAISKESLDMVYQDMVDSQSALDTLLNQSMTGEVPAIVESKRAALAKVERGTASLDKQRDDLVLRAPRSGIIGYRAAEVGAIAQAGQKVMELVDNSNIYIDCQLSEQDIAAVQLGISVEANVESLGKSYTGKIIYISPSAGATSKNYSVRMALDNADEPMKAGMFARTQIEIMQRAMTLFVPKEAVLEKNGKTSLFVIDGEHKVQERTVTLGLRNDAEVEILSGIAEGDVVAISNLARLKDGVVVDIGAGETS